MRLYIILCLIIFALTCLVGLLYNSRKRACEERDAQLSVIEAQREKLAVLQTRLDVAKDESTANTKVQAKQAKEGQLRKAKAQLYELCDASLLALPPGTPVDLHNRTLDRASQLLKKPTTSFQELIQREHYQCSGLWELYWCLARASQAAVKVLTVKEEDGISSRLIEILDASARKLLGIGAPYQRSLDLAFCQIYHQSVPAFKEVDVGADILLVIAGERLIDGGGARLIWIQAKKSDTKFTVDCTYANTRGLQLEALKNVNDPAKGSFSLYLKYSTPLNYLPAFALEDHTPPADRLNVDLGIYGVRLAELVTSIASRETASAGSFAQPSEIIAFIDSVAHKKPMFLVCATGADEFETVWKAPNLLEHLAQHYRRELGMPKTHEHEPAPGPRPAPHTPHKDKGRDFDR